MEELNSDDTAVDVIKKAWDVNESIKAIAEEPSPGTQSAMLQVAISSQRATLLNYNIPKHRDYFPDSIREGPPENETNQAKWHTENFPKATVSAVKLKVNKYQTYINQTSQVQKYDGPTDTSTPAAMVKQSSKFKKAEVTNTINNVSKVVTIENN